MGRPGSQGAFGKAGGGPGPGGGPLAGSQAQQQARAALAQAHSAVSPAALAEAEARHAEGFRLRREGDFKGAVDQYSRAIAAHPLHFKALFNRGFAFDKLGKYSYLVTVSDLCAL